MADEIKTAKAPEGKGGKGTEKIPLAEGEVEAHGYAVYYNCYNCHMTNKCDSDWSYFICFNCGANNVMN
jgi:hypothetical protein